MHTVHDSLFLEPYIASKLANAEFRKAICGRLVLSPQQGVRIRT